MVVDGGGKRSDVVLRGLVVLSYKVTIRVNTVVMG